MPTRRVLSVTTASILVLAAACTSAPPPQTPSSAPSPLTTSSAPPTTAPSSAPRALASSSPPLLRTTTTSSWASFEPSQGYRDRQSEYLQWCSDHSGPGQGGTYGQLCRLALNAGSLNEDAIRASLEKINAREDTADFGFNAIVRMLALYGDSPSLDPTLKQEMIDAVLNFKYWLDEPGTDTMCWWSENHQGLFHAAELVAGQLFPDTVFPNSGMTGLEHVEHALPLADQWLRYRGMFGFSEWHSNIYFNEDIPALVNIADFSPDEDVAARAAMVLDLLSFDMANTYYKGVFATVHGRTYEGTLIGGADDSTTDAAWMLLDLGQYQETGNFSATFLATSPRFWPPPILEDIARDAADSHEHRQRDGIDIAEGPDYGIGYEDYDDIMFYWGMGAYAASEVIYGTFEMVDYYDLWDDYFWGDYKFLKPLVGSPWLEPAAAAMDDITSGSALEAMNTYVYRTPHYQLSGAQDFNQGMYGAQAHIWQATLDANAFVFTTYPGGQEDDYAAGSWTGGWLPRATFYKNVGIIQYQRDVHPVADQAVLVEYSHAYFPRGDFDEVVQTGNWTFGRKGDAYVALYSYNQTAWATIDPQSEYELIADGIGNVWIVELGSKDENGDFSVFMKAISESPVWIGRGNVEYVSPSRGQVTVSLTGPMYVNDEAVDLGPYDRWDNAYAHQVFGTEQTTITLGNQWLELDFSAASRIYLPEGG